jgi:hypothetical protein
LKYNATEGVPLLAQVGYGIYIWVLFAVAYLLYLQYMRATEDQKLNITAILSLFGLSGLFFVVSSQIQK